MLLLKVKLKQLTQNCQQIVTVHSNSAMTVSFVCCVSCVWASQGEGLLHICWKQITDQERMFGFIHMMSYKKAWNITKILIRKINNFCLSCTIDMQGHIYFCPLFYMSVEKICIAVHVFLVYIEKNAVDELCNPNLTLKIEKEQFARNKCKKATLYKLY